MKIETEIIDRPDLKGENYSIVGTNITHREDGPAFISNYNFRVVYWKN